MADSKITALTALTAADPINDMLPIVDVSDTTMAASGTTKKISVNNILGASGTATLASATITGAATVGTTLGVTGVSTFAAGTAALPALTTTGDTNTGIYYPAADTFAVTTGGTERYRVDSTGLGIGVTPSNKLHIKGASGDTLIRIEAITDGLLGFIGSASGVISGSPANNLAIRAENGLYLSGNGNSTQFILNSAGNVTVSLGNVVMGTSGKGIDFSAVTGGTGTATGNVLNDYEEGTWTPTVTAETGTIGATVVNSANYTKIGRLVSVTFDITITTAGTGTAGLKLSLPFSCVAGSTAGATREYQTTGYMGQVFRFDATNVLVYNYINTTVISAGNKVMGGYTYFAS